MKRNELIIFDNFGVICGELLPKWFREHFSPWEAKKLKDKYAGLADIGEITREEMFEMMEKDLGYSAQSIAEDFKALYQINQPLVEYIRELHEEYYVALLSNAPLGVIDDLMDVFQYRDIFDAIFISSEMRIAKPDIRAYTTCINSFNRNFDAVYMIDDNPENLVPIQSLGGKGIVFTDNDDVYKAFPF